MTLVKRPISNFPVLSDLFDDGWFSQLKADWMPAVNVSDNTDNYEIEVAAPGLKKNDFNVSVENGILTITGKTETENEEKKKNYTRKEFSSRSFSRSFTLPENVKEEDVAAKHEDGILRLTLKKSNNGSSAQRKIEVA